MPGMSGDSTSAEMPEMNGDSAMSAEDMPGLVLTLQ